MAAGAVVVPAGPVTATLFRMTAPATEAPCSAPELTSSTSVTSKGSRLLPLVGGGFLTIGNTPLPPLYSSLPASSSFLVSGDHLPSAPLNLSKPFLAELSREVYVFLIIQSFYIYVYLICTSLSFLWLYDILLSGYTVIYN